MLLACLFTISVLSLPSLSVSRVEASGAPPARAEFYPKAAGKKMLASPQDAWGEDGEGGGPAEWILRRAVRKYPEDAEEHLKGSHRQISIPTGRSESSCPEVLARGTLAAIVAALAFLGFFSTSVLLVVVVCVLRIVDKQRKTGKEGKTGYPPSRRPLPPIPPPRPERTYMTMKPSGCELHPATARSTEGVYLSSRELNPGPRTPQSLHYQDMKASPQVKSTPENVYVNSEKARPFSTPPVTKNYVNVEESDPVAIMGGSPDIGMSPRGGDNHIYEEVE